jgi:hypothetical protein
MYVYSLDELALAVARYREEEVRRARPRRGEERARSESSSVRKTP